uniref:BHLH domain-containing protein n=1 Tax=Sinocyclocheilus rhinocerous TaxID=307959 RepID=A0A673KA84_9TELE
MPRAQCIQVSGPNPGMCLFTKHDDGTKSNPSKRHRDRLNGELGKLTALLPLPEEVRARLDKLSVLRLSVGYLKIKNYFTGESQRDSETSAFIPLRLQPAPGASVSLLSEGRLHGQPCPALNGFVLVVSTDGSIFYASPTIQDYLGFHQSKSFKNLTVPKFLNSILKYVILTYNPK